MIHIVYTIILIRFVKDHYKQLLHCINTLAIKMAPVNIDWNAILQDTGKPFSDEAKNILLNDPSLAPLSEQTKFISENWSDPLRPTLIKWGYNAVDGKNENIKPTCIALALMNLSFYLWDDLIDQAKIRMFKPTFFGKYGSDATIILGGLISAKAFTLLNGQNFDQTKQTAIMNEVWALWSGMATAEIKSVTARKHTYVANDKLLKIQEECKTNLATCLRLGAILGNGTPEEINHLGKYGEYLGIIIDLRNDIRVSANFGLELGQKIATGALPYTLLWAKEQDKQTAALIEAAERKGTLDAKDISQIVKSILATGAITKIQTRAKELTKKALVELSYLQRRPSTLEAFVEAQLQQIKTLP